MSDTTEIFNFAVKMHLACTTLCFALKLPSIPQVGAYFWNGEDSLLHFHLGEPTAKKKQTQMV